MKIAVLCMLTSGALFYFGVGLHPIAPLAWIAPLPALYWALRATFGHVSF